MNLRIMFGTYDLIAKKMSRSLIPSGGFNFRKTHNQTIFCKLTCLSYARQGLWILHIYIYIYIYICVCVCVRVCVCV